MTAGTFDWPTAAVAIAFIILLGYIYKGLSF